MGLKPQGLVDQGIKSHMESERERLNGGLTADRWTLILRAHREPRFGLQALLSLLVWLVCLDVFFFLSLAGGRRFYPHKHETR